MAIGLGLMIGFTLSDQFQLPLHLDSRSPSSGGAGTSRCRPGSATISTFRSAATASRPGAPISICWIVFLLCGLWHGAAWNFVVWGAAHGGFLVLERAGFARVLERCRPSAPHVYVMLAVMATWVLFRADTLGAPSTISAALVGLGASSAARSAVASLPRHRRRSGHRGGRRVGSLWRPFADHARRVRVRAGQVQVGQLAGLTVLLGLITLSLAGGAYNPFIYFRF